MSLPSSFVACPNLQASLIELWNRDNLAPNPSPFVEFVLSSENKLDTLQQSINMKPGGIRTVRMTYGQRYLEATVGDEGNVSCDAAGIDGELYEDYDIDPTVGARPTPMLIRSEDLRTRCENDKLYLARVIKKMMDVAVEKIETDGLTALSNNIGNYAYYFDENGSTSNAAIVTKTQLSDGTIVPYALRDVRFHFKNNGYGNVKPFGIGTKIWEDYAILNKVACCSQIGSNVTDYLRANGDFGLAYSHKIADILGQSNDAVFIAPGTVQMISFNQFRGLDGNIDYIDSEILKQGVIKYPDARYPLEFAYRASYECENDVFQWKISIALAYDFVFQPEDLYQVGDRFEGINGISQFRITN